jgi:hypothetical protein
VAKVKYSEMKEKINVKFTKISGTAFSYSIPNASSAGLKDKTAEITIYEARLVVLLCMATKLASHPSEMTETQTIWRQGPEENIWAEMEENIRRLEKNFVMKIFINCAFQRILLR